MNDEQKYRDALERIANNTGEWKQLALDSLVIAQKALGRASGLHADHTVVERSDKVSL